VEDWFLGIAMYALGDLSKWDFELLYQRIRDVIGWRQESLIKEVYIMNDDDMLLLAMSSTKISV
jgi:hypothetical protein